MQYLDNTTSNPIATKIVTRIIVAIVILFAILGTLPFWLTDLDMNIARTFYDVASAGESREQRWPTGYQPWAKGFFIFGYVFVYGILLIRIALWVLPAPYRPKLPASFMRVFNVFFLTLVVGTGILVNGLSKPLTERARPAQNIEFQGDCAYSPPLTMGGCDHGKSFPCGHCTVGFSFAAIGIALLVSRPWLGLAIFIGSLGFGAAMSMGRITAGGHFLSDAMWSAVFMWLSAFFSRWLVDRWQWFR